MNASGAAGFGACPGCMRRSRLLSALSPLLEYQCNDRVRLAELLRLGDEDLLQAIGGRRKDELKRAYGRFQREDGSHAKDVGVLCRHNRSYPPALAGPDCPSALYVAGGVKRFTDLMSAPTVAVVGSSKATDYGMETARCFARGLAASGATVMSGLCDGIAVAAQHGALETDARTLAVLDGGLDVACPARRRALYEQIRRSGCAVAELPCGCGPRRWTHAASERILAALAQLTVVVEARDNPAELAGARLAQELGRSVAAVPGRVTSPASGGAHRLLMEGADLVRGPADALELLCGVGNPRTAPAGRAPVNLRPGLQVTLELVAGGRDTAEKLLGDRRDCGEMLLALSELELMGLLARGDGGRYVPRFATLGDCPARWGQRRR